MDSLHWTVCQCGPMDLRASASIANLRRKASKMFAPPDSQPATCVLFAGHFLNLSGGNTCHFGSQTSSISRSPSCSRGAPRQKWIISELVRALHRLWQERQTSSRCSNSLVPQVLVCSCVSYICYPQPSSRLCLGSD